MKAACVVADAGPLIGLARIARLTLLRDLFSTAIVPEQVFAECVRVPDKPGATAIRQATEAGWLEIRSSSVELASFRPANLGMGEVAAVALALELKCPVLMDDKVARAFAQRAGLAVIGTGGILLAAKNAGLIASVRSALTDLSAAGYHLSIDLRQRILELAGEGA